jgi:hypothetical protein
MYIDTIPETHFIFFISLGEWGNPDLLYWFGVLKVRATTFPPSASPSANFKTWYGRTHAGLPAPMYIDTIPEKHLIFFISFGKRGNPDWATGLGFFLKPKVRATTSSREAFIKRVTTHPWSPTLFPSNICCFFLSFSQA